jgi:lipopolysaccharide/colanic/teichoic acid biosynthesis glycosyltransferase
VVVSGLVLVAATPVLLALALLVRARLGPPAFFVQTRPGLDGRPFRMVKLRSMSDARGPDGRPLPDEARLTPFGSWLRSTSLDELPELWNVLRGEMSLVGPRPLLTEYLALYDDDQRRRHDMPPGITGWAAVNGRNALSWEDKFRLDLWYVDNWSLWLDLRILALTLRQVLSRAGINQPGRATAEPFRGS